MTDDGRQMTEKTRGQMTDDGRQMTEKTRRQMTDDRWQKIGFFCLLSSVLRPLSSVLCRLSSVVRLLSSVLRRPFIGNAAFTLLEVMVACGILAISLTVLLTFSGNSMRKSARAEQMLIATQLAREKMSELELELAKGQEKGEFPDEKSEEGKFDEPNERYSWKMEIRKVELPAPVQGEKGSVQDVVGRKLTKEISETVRELKLTIKWGEGEAEESFDLVTHIVKM